MKYNQLSRYILSLLLSSALLCGCNEQRPMAVISEEENSFQDSAGGATILESVHLETVDSAPVPATIDVVQEAAAHGSSASRGFEVGDSLGLSALSSIARKTGLEEVVSFDGELSHSELGMSISNLGIDRQDLEDTAASRVAVATEIARANEAIVRANTERDEAVARANTERNAAVARANEAEEALAARDQEIAQISNVLAAALRTRTFGAAEWKHYFGGVGSAPDLPSDMAAILDGPCPFWTNKKVRDTHLLVLIPATVGGVPFTLNLLGELIKRPKNGGHRTEYRFYSGRVKAQIGEQSPPRSYWLLMTRDVLPGSRNKAYVAQKELVAGYTSRASVPYELPSVLEAATAILMHHAREGERLFGDDPWTFARCQEMVMVGENPCQTVVGGFSSRGLNNHILDSSVSRYVGVSCLRRF